MSLINKHRGVVKPHLQLSHGWPSPWMCFTTGPEFRVGYGSTLQQTYLNWKAKLGESWRIYENW